MKKLTLTFFAGLTAFALTAFAEPTWTTDFPAAQTQAKKDKKLILMNFTGSDWCGWCIKLKKEVFDTKEFADYVKDNVVLVDVDFPTRKPQSAELKKANEGLKAKYRAEQGFPTIIVLNSEGKEVWRQVGYMKGGPKAWIDKLNEVKKN